MKRLLYILILFAIGLGANAQDEPDGVPFNGLVVDIVGEPLKNVKVYNIDPNYAAFSDKKGRFGLVDVQATDTLHLVYKRKHYDIPVAGRRSLRIVLGDQFVQRADESEDLVDQGYGYISRRESILSSNGISGEVLQRTGCVRLLDALQGLVPGLEISVNLMGEATATIRGIGSINCPTTPLFIVDGVEVSTLDFINIYDVDHVEVMKEASIYGSRGANGAILVTTKRGKNNHF